MDQFLMCFAATGHKSKRITQVAWSVSQNKNHSSPSVKCLAATMYQANSRWFLNLKIIKICLAFFDWWCWHSHCTCWLAVFWSSTFSWNAWPVVFCLCYCFVANGNSDRGAVVEGSGWGNGMDWWSHEKVLSSTPAGGAV